MNHFYSLGKLMLFLLVVGYSQQAKAQNQGQDPIAIAVNYIPNTPAVCGTTNLTIDIGNGPGASEPILPGQVEWQFNLPYDILIVGVPLTLPPQIGIKSRTCDPVLNETRIVLEVLQNIPTNTVYNIVFPITGILPNIPNRTITNQIVLVTGFIPFSGNVVGNDFSSTPITFAPQSCVEYRTRKAGNWNDPDIWEVFTCLTRDNATCLPVAGGWANNNTIPTNTTSNVLVRHDVVLNVNYTVTNCPLTLDNAPLTTSKLTIDPNITLGFGGGADGNAYFNGRPVVVKSTAAGTGAIGRMLANSETKGDNNVTVERFLPGDPQRRWNLLTFAVRGDATIRDAWAGGSRKRVSNSQNSINGVPLGNPGVKPNNVPYDAADNGMPADYVAGDGTIITGNRYTSAAASNAAGYDWWPELIIPQGATWYTSPGNSLIAGSTQTTPSSIRPYRPTATSDFGTVRGTAWVSNADINTGFGGSGLINMSLSNAYDQYKAFMLFTRGDRMVLENWRNSTTLRPTGQIMKQTVNVPITASTLQVLANPFPAPVDFQNIWNANQGVIESYFYFWNSQLNGTSGNGAWEVIYRTVIEIDLGDGPVQVVQWRKSTNLTPPNFSSGTIAGNNSLRVISSSQGFMVQGTSGGGNLVLNEAMKVALTNNTIRPFDQEVATDLGTLITNLNYRSSSTGELSYVDGINILLATGFKEDLSDKSDISKINSHTGTLGLSIKRGENLLMVESYPSPTAETVFPLLTPGLTERTYSFTFDVTNLYAAGREAFLRDKFLNTLTPISTTEASEYKFEGTADIASLNENRFEIVFKQSEILPVTFTSINAVEQGKNIKVSWNVATEEKMSHYEVEHSTNGTEFGKAVKVDAKNTSPAAYDWLHVQPGAGDHFYRVRAFNLEGRSMLTRVVKVTLGDNAPGFKAFPTVVSATRQVTLQLISLDKGNYTLQVTDMAGKVISSRSIEHNGGSASMIMQMPPSLSAGKYNIRLTGTSGNFVQPLVKD